jgi:hypothetical protein
MSKRVLGLLAVLALVVAACGGGTASSTTAAPAPEQTSTTPPPAAEAVLLSYTLTAGDEFHYEVAIDQHIEMSAEGDAAVMGEEEMPGSASIDLSGTGNFTQVVSAGPSEGTYEVHLTGEFSDVSVTGTVDGEPVDSSEVPEFAAIEPIDVTFVVDEQGKVVGDGADADDSMAGMLGGLGALGEGGAVPGLDFGQFIGIPLSDQEVTVGDTWTEEVEIPGMMAEEPIVTTITSEVTGVDEVAGAEVFVIATETATSPIEFDMAEFFAGMFGAFTPQDATEEEVAEMEAMLAELRFLISIEGSISESTTLFDPEAGLARQVDTTGATDISMDMNVPDEETKDMVGFVMNMNLDQVVSFKLTSGPTA